MTFNFSFPIKHPAGKFLGNRKLYSAAYRRFIQADDRRNPLGYEPDWDTCVIGPPQHDDATQLAVLKKKGYVGLYERTDELLVDVPDDDDPFREPDLVLRLRYETDVSRLVASGMSQAAARAFSGEVLEQLAEVLKTRT